MHIYLGEAEKGLQATVRRFARRQVAPRSAEWDRGQVVDPEVLRAYVELGVPKLRIPREYGGEPGSLVMLGIAVEETGRGDFSFAQFALTPAIYGEFLTQARPEVQAEWLPRIGSLESIGALAITEPGSGSDAASLKMTAIRQSNGWVLNGEKASITNAGDADVSLVFARTGGTGARGISCFLIPLDKEGITRQVYRSPGGRLSQRGSLIFDNVHIPASHLIGEENKGFHLAMRFFDHNRALLGLQALGGAEESLEETIEYVKKRIAFGRPLSNYQAVSFQIADYLTMVEGARLLCYQALSRKDRGEPCSKEAAMAKWFASTTAFNIIHGCLLLHGHYGYNEDLPFERRLRDVMGNQIADGTEEVMKLIIAREVLGREAVDMFAPNLGKDLP